MLWCHILTSKHVLSSLIWYNMMLRRSVRPVSIRMYRSAKILENWKNPRSYSFEKTVENWKNTETWHGTEKVLEFNVFPKVQKIEKTQFSSTFWKTLKREIWNQHRPIPPHQDQTASGTLEFLEVIMDQDWTYLWKIRFSTQFFSIPNIGLRGRFSINHIKFMQTLRN